MAKKIETQEIYQGSTKEVMPEQSTKDAHIFLAETDIAVVGSVDDEYAENLNFMEEKIVVVIHKTANKFEDDPVLGGVNGVPVTIRRGIHTKAKRKFINAILGSALTDVECLEVTNERGEKGTKIIQRSAERYPITIMHDPSPQKGRKWVEQALRNGGA